MILVSTRSTALALPSPHNGEGFAELGPEGRTLSFCGVHRCDNWAVARGCFRGLTPVPLPYVSLLAGGCHTLTFMTACLIAMLK